MILFSMFKVKDWVGVIVVCWVMRCIFGFYFIDVFFVELMLGIGFL